MEDYVYIILVILWLVASLMKRKSKNQEAAKPKPPAKPQPASPSREFDLEEVLQEMFGGKSSTKPDAVPQPISRKEPDEPVFENGEPEYERMAEELSTYQEPEYHSFGGQETIPEEYRFSTEVRDQTLEELIRSNQAEDARLQAAEEMRNALEDDALASGFNAREAVLFSEIINRKYS